MARPPREQAKQEDTSFLVFVNEDEGEDQYVEEELAGLCEASNVTPVGSIRQRVDRPTKASYIGSGKVNELAAHVSDTRPDVVIFDCELTGIQARNIQDQIHRPVLDRTQLILDIFARRAKTREGQLQVELAQLSYLLPRLMSVYTKFERQRGGIGMRGPGETKLETDRRMVRDRIAKLTGEIEEVKRHRELQRTSRRKFPFPFATICGYTSAGKSTLMNHLAGTHLLADAMPFATLDPTTRKIDLHDGYSMFLTDTVGFIRKLPTHLVAAFRATLEEVIHADIVLHVVDISTPEWELQHDAVLETLAMLGAADKPILTVFNKIDTIEKLPTQLTMEQPVSDRFLARSQADQPRSLEEAMKEFPQSVAISALTGEGIPEMLDRIRDMVREFLGLVRALVPYDKSNLIDDCYHFGRVITVEYRDDGIFVEAELVKEMRSLLKQYELTD